jgi:hypothetical protein
VLLARRASLPFQSFDERELLGRLSAFAAPVAA